MILRYERHRDRVFRLLAVMGIVCGLPVWPPATGRGDESGPDLEEVASVPVAPAATGPASAPVVAISGAATGPVDPVPQPGLPLRCRVKLDVTGELIAPAGRDAPPIRRPITVDARFDFEEAVVREAAVPTVSRSYTDAVASLRIGGEEAVTSLADDARRLLVVRQGTTPEPYLEEAFLTAAERDLLSLPFDPLLLDDLIPRGAVAAGEGWQVAADLAAGLLAIDTIESGAIEARLEEVIDGRARVALRGTVEGWVDGVPAKVTVSGGFAAPAREADAEDTDAETPAWRIEPRIEHVSVMIRERRQAGHVAPGLDVEARLVVARSSSAGSGVGRQPTARDEAAKDGNGPAATEEKRRPGPGRPGRVWHRDAGGRFDLVHDARWRTVEDGPAGLVMRFVDHGALVGQCSVVAGAVGDSSPTIADVRGDIERTLAGQVTGVDEATEEERADGVRVVRVVSSGTASGLPFTWIHSVLVGPDGGRVDVACMVQASMRERFADADRDLVGSLVPGDARAGGGRPGKETAESAPTAIREARTPDASTSAPAVPR